MNEDYAKFKQYWIDLGKPDLEIKKKHEEDSQFVRRQLQEMEYFDPTLDYRLAGDRHWRLRKEWVDSDFKLPIECRVPKGNWVKAVPNWARDLEYQKKPSQSAVELTEVLIQNMQNANPECEQKTPYPKVIKKRDPTATDRISNNDFTYIKSEEALREYVDEIANQKEQTEDPGRHYRFVYDVIVTPEAAERGYVAVKLDPFRIAAIYGMTDFALQTILEKTLCAGNRGHNDLREDLKDIICAAQRKLEMLDEDETTPTIPENI